MQEQDLDTAYSALCHTMTRLGEAQAPLFLARFALLTLHRLGDATVVQQLIEDAARDLTPTA